MPLIVTADLHLSANARDDYRFRAMASIGELITKHKADALVILGDLTEEKNYHSARLTNDVVELIFSFSCLCRVYILRGNHDYTEADCPFFKFTHHLKNVVWINSPERLFLGGGLSCLFLPHTIDWERDWKPVLADDSIWESGLWWVFAHNTFEGAKTEHGKFLKGIPLGVLPDDVPVISGDIHSPQTIGNVTYVGSPYTIDFGDEFEPRVFLLTDYKCASIPLRGPQKRLVELDDIHGPWPTGAKALQPEDIVKVRYKLKAQEREHWPGIKNQIREYLCSVGCQPYLIQPQLEPMTRSRKDGTGVVHKQTDEQLVRQFSHDAKVSEDALNFGLDLLREA